MKMPRTLVLLAAITLSIYGGSALSQAAPPTGQPAQGEAATNDEALTKAIHAALEADPNHFFRHVTVRVDNGVATLGGFVNSSSAIHRARTIAGQVPGVTRVVSGNLTLEPNRPR